MKSIGLFWNSKQVIGGQVLECPYSEDCDKAKIVSSQNVQEKFEVHLNLWNTKTIDKVTKKT